jgi:enterochelin esterase family protein
MRAEDVTFTWSEPDPEHPALAVLVRLVALTDYAFDDGDLSPYLMRPQPGGDWTVTLSLPSTLRSSYQFCPIRDRDLADELLGHDVSEAAWARVLAVGEPDPQRPPTFAPGTLKGNPGRPPSIVELSGALPQPALRTGVPQGLLTRHEIAGAQGPPSVVHVHRPAEPGPELAVVFDAKFWLSTDITSMLDHLVADRAVPPLTTVLVESIHGASRHEGLTHPERFEPFLVEELRPWLTARFGLGAGPTVLAGQSLGGLTASWAALRRPDLFGRVIISSMAAWWPGDRRGGLSGEQVVAAFQAGPAAPVRFFLEAGSQERELLASVRTFHAVLAAKGYDVSYREYEGGHDIACWRGGLADGLAALMAA